MCNAATTVRAQTTNDFQNIVNKKLPYITQDGIINKERGGIIERFHSRGHRPYWFSETKDNVCIKIQFNSRRIGLVHQYGRRFFVLEHQYGRRDVI